MKSSTDIIIYFCLILFIYMAYSLVGTLMYTYALVDFYDHNWTYSDSISINGTGMSKYSTLVNVKDLQPIGPADYNGIDELCVGVESERGFVTRSTIDDLSVCCAIDEDQWLVPTRDDEKNRYYMCGSWPLIDIVYQPLEQVTYKF